MSLRPVIYQLFPRLFTNKVEHPRPNGTMEQNGVGKFNDINFPILNHLAHMGVTHIWLTGILRHATQTDYPELGLPATHPAIVKGKAGSPYAVTDYYDVDPDLAVKPRRRVEEFQALLERIHRVGMHCLVDFVPNHVSRVYQSRHLPAGARDLGAEDNPEQAFSPHNNFYYIPGQSFHSPCAAAGPNPYVEQPAKASGNDVFTATPGLNDWYDTVKLNYGVDYVGGTPLRVQPQPDTWQKMLDILLYWLRLGVDGFRCDMVEMVPVEFWRWAIDKIREVFPHALFIGEIYNPLRYHDYLFGARFDYLYDKVGLYDTLRAVTCGHQSATALTQCWQSVEGYADRMLAFLENHDEQRIASDFFAGNPQRAFPAMTVAALMHCNPLLIYNAQELGERGMDQEGYSGTDGRTTIFDYWSMETTRRWLKTGRPNKQRLTASEQEVLRFYTTLLSQILPRDEFQKGAFFDLMYVNPLSLHFDANHIYAFLRKHGNQLAFVVANFSDKPQDARIVFPLHAFQHLRFQPSTYEGSELFSGRKSSFNLQPDVPIAVSIAPWSSVVWSFNVLST